jgi:hypothetical protein
MTPNEPHLLTLRENAMTTKNRKGYTLIRDDEGMLIGAGAALLERMIDVLVQSPFESDARELPDEARYRAFKRGWRDSALERRKYSDETLKTKTWQNVGYRLGMSFGLPDEDGMRLCWCALVGLT